MDAVVSSGRRNTNLLAAAIVLSAFVLRVIDLPGNPPGVWSDEASIGWNAYCILKTGRNEYGQYLPLSFPSIEKFDPVAWKYDGVWDYKGPVEVYAAVPFVALFGPVALAVRLPAAIMGSVMVWMAYLLARRWWGAAAGLAAAGLTALSPWALHFSRIGYGACLAAPLIAVALHFFFSGLERPRRLPLSGVFFGLAAYSYQICQMFCPMLMAALAVTHFRPLWARRRWAVGWALAAAVLTTPMAIHLLRNRMKQAAGDPTAEQRRFEYISVFSEKARRDFADQEAKRRGRPELADSATFHRSWSTAAYVYGRFWSPGFLVGHGDTQARNSLTGYLVARPETPERPRPAWYLLIGQLLWAEAILAAAGLVWVLRNLRRPLAQFLLVWLLIWPMPASLTVESVPQAIRSIVSLPLWQLLGGAAVGWLWQRRRLPDGRLSPWAWPLGASGGLWAVQVCYLLMTLYTIYPAAENVDVQDAWDHHVPDVIAYGMAQHGRFERCTVSPIIDRMNTYIAFYLPANPRDHLAGRRPFMWGEPFGKFDDRHLYLLSTLDERNPALLRLWAEVGAGPDQVARAAATLPPFQRGNLRMTLIYDVLGRSVAPGATAPVFPAPPRLPKWFFVTADIVRAAAGQLARSGHGSQSRGTRP